MMMNLVVVYVPSHATTISDLEKEKDELDKKEEEAKAQKEKDQSELDDANSKADAIEGELDEIEGEIDEIDECLVETIAAMELVKEEIAALELKIVATELQYEEAKKEEEAQYESMKLRIRYMYEKGDVTYLNLLIESQGFSDMMNKAEYIEKLYEYDRKLLLEYQSAKEETLRIKAELEEEKDELDISYEQLEEEQAYYDELLDEMKEKYDSYEAELSSAKAKAQRLKDSISKKNAEIKKLEEQKASKQDEIDKAKKEEEERKAAEKAAEEARRQSENSSSSQSSSKGSSSEAPKSDSKSYNPASYYNSGDRGKDIVNYALQFVGNPYVSGGTSLTSGADCSGFIMRLYKDFGYSLPRTSTSMRSVGREVSYDEARPGDIVCYAGHVALYMGNGQIVHASTPATGIKIGSIFYKQFITIRRVF